ncbi:hypothetical protein B7P43_G13278 [Cryptotermes secundus]|uniref:G-protein coupled receptors family 1 profile domain-containing protein n=1 Tax=Cryptotermes secundus TaxID=105785 RepID=A0A2J7PE20_9NEOP|nr:hypothetical protein B7P43_G13278 [Cryptotermes secundus]
MTSTTNETDTSANTVYQWSVNISVNVSDVSAEDVTNINNWWALLALALVLGTAAGNILVCLAITWERRLQNVTNYFLMSLAITDLMVAVLVMPLGILTLVRGFFPLPSIYCLAWICLDVLFCTASIMHLCTISVDRYLSLRYPMKFGRNKTRKRVTLKIVFVWLLSIAMSLPLCLMYSQDHDSVLVEGTCQIPDPLYKLIGSIVCFYIPLGVMLLTYALTVRLLAVQQQNLGGGGAGWSSGWLGPGTPSLGQAHHHGNNRGPMLRRAATLRHHNGTSTKPSKPTKTDNTSTPCLLMHYGSGRGASNTTSISSRTGTIRSHHSRNSSVISRNSSRHGRIIRLEQKATKVLGVVFFTFVILWAPFFVLNLVPTVCADCERNIHHGVFDFVTWLGYASSMVNPIFYTIFNKVFRQAFKKVLLCRYRNRNWRPPR